MPLIEKWIPFSSFEKCSPLLKNNSQKINSTIENCNQYLWFSFFYLLSGCPMANFGTLSRGKPYSINVSHCIYQLSSHTAACSFLQIPSQDFFFLSLSCIDQSSPADEVPLWRNQAPCFIHLQGNLSTKTSFLRRQCNSRLELLAKLRWWQK